MIFIGDKHYIDLVLNGNHAAYRFLVDRYKKMVFSICLRILPNTEDAEDASQESFLRAFQQLNTYEGKSKFSTWLYTITYRISVSNSKKIA
ncbi:MAG: sigma-70 family RNA polymerase sigma factor [Spirosomataceae bacterium]